jgi:uncharacterized protein
MATEDELVISAVDDIRSIPKAAWDALLSPADTPFVRHDWLASLEEAGCVRAEAGWMPYHLTARRGEQLVAAAPLYVKGTMEGEFVFDHAWAQYAARIGVKYYPKVIVAVPFTPATGRRLLVAPGEDRPKRSALLLRALPALVERLGVSSAHVLFANDEDRASLEKAGYAVRAGVQYHWRNRGYATYDDFLATFNSKRRHQLKRERREVEQSGIVTTSYSGAAITDEVLSAMVGFYIAGVERHFPWGRQYLNEQFFSLVRERMPESLDIVLAREGGRPIAGTFNVQGGGKLYGRYWGASDHRPFLHFHVCYYHAIEQCILRKLDAFEPGAGGEHKLPRGFDPTLTHSGHLLVDRRLDRAIRQYVADEREAIERELLGDAESTGLVLLRRVDRWGAFGNERGSAPAPPAGALPPAPPAGRCPCTRVGALPHLVRQGLCPLHPQRGSAPAPRPREKGLAAPSLLAISHPGFVHHARRFVGPHAPWGPHVHVGV